MQSGITCPVTRIRLLLQAGAMEKDLKCVSLDIMFVDKRIKVDEDVKPRLNPNVPIITMKTDDVKPGYTKFEVEYNRDQYFSKCCEELYKW